MMMIFTGIGMGSRGESAARAGARAKRFRSLKIKFTPNPEKYPLTPSRFHVIIILQRKSSWGNSLRGSPRGKSTARFF